MADLAFAPFLLLVLAAAAPGHTLPNGIQLPQPWPPEYEPTYEGLRVPPYLTSPPEVIPIDLGRQLFVDDFLIEDTTLTRTHHHAKYSAANPLLRPDKPWEMEGDQPTAMPFSDGVWWDPADRLFKAWYMGGYVRYTCLAISRDGLRWEKPELDVVPGTNIVHQRFRDSATVWLDLEAKDPSRRYVLSLFPYPEGSGALETYFSADGIHWGPCAVRTGPTGDRSTIFWNPFLRTWVYGIRWDEPGLGRTRSYRESPDLIAGTDWEAGEPVHWIGADRLDPPRPDYGTPCQLYNLDCVAYESILLGLFSIWRGQAEDRAKPNEICVGYSRDGFHWSRPDRQAFIPVSERYGDWNWANVQSAGGCCLVVGNELWFYVSGRSGRAGSRASGVSAMGLARLRRDGFVSMDAGPEGGTLTTRRVRFRGRHLFVNLDAPQGSLRVEVLDAAGQPVAPFTAANCRPVKGNATLLPVHWRSARDLSAVAGKAVRFRFHLQRGRLYAFWVSPEASGASHGYVAAGGPGFTGPTDSTKRE